MTIKFKQAQPLSLARPGSDMTPGFYTLQENDTTNLYVIGNYDTIIRISGRFEEFTKDRVAHWVPANYPLTITEENDK